MMGARDGQDMEDEPNMEAFLQVMLQEFMSKEVLNGPMQVISSSAYSSWSEPVSSCNRRIMIHSPRHSHREALYLSPPISVKI